jgi:hypothetical protein
VPSGGVRPSGGCAGGARGAPKLSGGPKLVPKMELVPKVTPKLGPKLLNEPPAPLPGRIGGLRDALNPREWGLLVVAARARPGELPAVVGRHLDALNVNAGGLKELGNLRDLVHAPWPPDVRAEDVVTGLMAFENVSPQEAPALRHYLVLRAEMEGHPDLAQKLLPPGEALDAPSVLRDLKVLEGVSATPRRTSPLGDLPLPEPEPLSLKPPVREVLTKGLPGLDVEDLPPAELRARRGVLRAIETSADRHWNHVVISLHNLKGVTTDSDPDDREADVERQLGQLTPEERLLVRRLLRTKTTVEVVAVLRQMRPK